MKKTTAAAVLLSGLGLVGLGPAAGIAQAYTYGPFQWCPGQAMPNDPPRAATDSEDAFAQAVGFGNRAIAVGDGATAAALGGDGLASISKFPIRRPKIGNNTAITLGKGSNSYAGSLPPKAPPGNAPKDQFAAAIGDHRNALNGINNK